MLLVAMPGAPSSFFAHTSSSFNPGLEKHGEGAKLSPRFSLSDGRHKAFGRLRRAVFRGGRK